MKQCHFYIIPFDGFNVGLKDDFNSTWLEFDSFEEAKAIAQHWDKWIIAELDKKENGL